MVVGCVIKFVLDFGGCWKLVNCFVVMMIEILLYFSYVYQVLLMDGMFKVMFECWVKDFGCMLDYCFSLDFILYGVVLNIDIINVQQVVIDLMVVYVVQGIFVFIVGNQIVVQSVGLMLIVLVQGVDFNSGI